MPGICITGANRGLGLEFTRQYAADGWQVLACCRDPAAATSSLGGFGGDVRVVALDAGDPESIRALAAQIRDPLDVLMNNAGVFAEADEMAAGDMDAYTERWRHDFQINAVAPLLVTRALLPHIMRGKHKKIIAISSRMGSIGMNRDGGYTIYRSTKAALNMAMNNLALELQPQGVSVNVLHPGWVRTDMGGRQADLAPEESVKGMRRVIAGLDPARTGKFYDYKGEELPW